MKNDTPEFCLAECKHCEADGFCNGWDRNVFDMSKTGICDVFECKEK